MKSLKFHFCHPVKGIVILVNKTSPGLNKVMPFSTAGGEVANIPVDGLTAGRWKATLEWEYNNKEYLYEKEFEIQKGSFYAS